MKHSNSLSRRWFRGSVAILVGILIMTGCVPSPSPIPTQPASTQPPMGPTPAASLSPLTRCIGFEDLASGTKFQVPATFPTSGATIAVLPFQWSNQTWTATGPGATVQQAKQAGGSGNELFVNNVNLGFDVGELQCVKMRFHDMGGNVNLLVDGLVGNFPDFPANGTLGGATVSVTSDANGTILTLSGKLPRFLFQEKWPISFAVGGQELPIDDICPCEE
jgi:hypothetical protein